MKKTKHLILVVASVLFLLSFVQSATAQEWKVLSRESDPGIGSLTSFLQSTLGMEEEAANLRKSGPITEPSQRLTDRDLMRLNNDRNREYAREGSWAPLETKPGQENFHLFTF